MLQSILARRVPPGMALFHLFENIGCFEAARGNYSYPAAPSDGMDIAKSSRIDDRTRRAVRQVQSQVGLGGHGTRSGMHA